MKPEQFIREYGPLEAKIILDAQPESAEYAVDFTMSGEFSYLRNLAIGSYEEFDGHSWKTINYVPLIGASLSVSMTGAGYLQMTLMKDVPFLELSCLKRLVESIDLVESWGGIDDVKLYDLSHCKDIPESAGYKLLQAIRDHESIYGDGESHAN